MSACRKRTHDGAISAKRCGSRTSWASWRVSAPKPSACCPHFDSVAEAPGAADDALGVAVALETARLFAARPNRRWSLFVLVTDAEESGLMGAAALVGERDITDRLKAYINIEAIGSAGYRCCSKPVPATDG